MIDFHGYALNPPNIVYFHREKSGERWGVIIVVRDAPSVFIPESANAPPYDESRALYTELLGALMAARAVLIHFRDLWISPHNVVTAKAGKRDMTSVTSKEKTKKESPTIALEMVNSTRYFDYDTIEQAEQELTHLVEAINAK